jgi:hypothetical protein
MISFVIRLRLCLCGFSVLLSSCARILASFLAFLHDKAKKKKKKKKNFFFFFFVVVDFSSRDSICCVCLCLVRALMIAVLRTQLTLKTTAACVAGAPRGCGVFALLAHTAAVTETFSLSII